MNVSAYLFRIGIFTCCIFLCNSPLYSQCKSCGPNLAPNPDFEITTSQCSVKDQQLYTNQTPIKDWYGTACVTCPSNGITPDNFNSSCTGNATSNCGSGSGSAGVFTSTGNGDAREYIQAKLTSPLKAGKQYCVTVKVKSSGGSFIPTDGAGIWFNSIGLIDIDAMNASKPFLGPGSKINATPQIQNAAGNIIGTTCQTLSGSFCAAGGEQWIVLGNFKKDSELQPFTTCDCAVGGACGTQCKNCLGSVCMTCPCKGASYVIFDEVSVQESCATNLTITATANPAALKCGDCTTISATATGGDGTYVYTWSPDIGKGGGPHKVCPVKTTTYTVVASSKGNCGLINDTSTVTVTVDCGPTVITTNTSVCEGACSTLRAIASGGTPPYKFSWNPALGLSTATGDSVYACPAVTTTYTVTAVDKNGAGLSATATAVVTVNSKPVIAAASAAICAGDSTVLTASGAKTYTWSPTTGLNMGTGASVTAHPTTTTTYTVTGLDANGCSGSTEVVVKVNEAPAIKVNDVSICPGNSVILTATGASSYSWSPNTGLSATTGDAVTANPATTTTYTITGTSAGCSASTTATVTVGAIIADAGPDRTICKGDSVQLKASGGSVYKWIPSTGLNNDGIANPIAFPGVTTTYIVNVSSGTCQDQDTMVVSVNASPVLTIEATDITCFGLCDGKTAVSISGGAPPFTYAWNSGCTLPSCNNLCSGTYTLIVKDALNCKTSGTLTIKEPAALTATVNQQKNPSCFGICDGSAEIVASGGKAPYAYLWKGSGETSPGIKSLCSGNYTCTVTDANKCSVSTSLTISQPSAITITVRNVTICPNTPVQLTALGSGGAGSIQFTWTPSASLSSPTGATVTASPSTTTTYTITGTDSNGCVGSTTAVVTVQPLASINVKPDTICQGASTILSAEGADTYTWTPSTGLNTTTGNVVTASPITTTTYTVSGLKNGCKSLTTVVVTVYPSPVIVLSPASICPGEDTVLTASGATTYLWVPKESLNNNIGSSVIANPLTTTTYTVVGKNLQGCSGTSSVLVTVNPKPEAKFKTTPTSTDVFNPLINFYDQSQGGIMTKWNWNFGDADNSSSVLQNPAFSYIDSVNSYTVRLIVQNQYGCMDTTVSLVRIKGIFTFYVPNAFTPNEDGLNSAFTPMGVGVDKMEYEFWIFDRWGNLIWHTNTWGEGWDGRANGGSTVSQMDTYVWKVHVKEQDSNRRHDYIGHVTIVK